ncbi:50S ribosomal protein L18, chloroplastic-like isoform X2 [Phalaenopsis equestris]|uniref:50S ribosomal protein L18, chloroplastic-like isoform X2 n=1 Tax=Phalaenopsis equestris TaxID=78828 RepID=UPI0009E37E4C|nr:50S ribosomal protein L18, chloroplastic-like isoform X2 [Phalaenopsis equestris]
MATPAPPLATRSFFSSIGSRGFPFSLRLDFTGGISGQSYRANTRPGIPYIEAKASTRRENRAARHERVRKKVHGTPERPRMCVFRSNKHLYVQVIDDTKMHTLAAASTMQKPVTEEVDFSSGPTIESINCSEMRRQKKTDGLDGNLTDGRLTCF